MMQQTKNHYIHHIYLGGVHIYHVYLGVEGLVRSTWKKQALPSAEAVAIAVPSGENVADTTFCKGDHRITIIIDRARLAILSFLGCIKSL